MRRALAVLAVALFVVACGKKVVEPAHVSLPNATAVNHRPIQVPTSPRFRVERVQVVSDALAYDDKRGIYLVKDSETGREWIGISGIGISELGSHSSGKTTVSDER